MKYLLAEFDLAARTMARESDHSYGDRLGIAHVFKNRLEKTTGQFRKDDTLATTVTRHVQFSVWTPSDPNFNVLYELTYSDLSLRQCLEILLNVFNGGSDDPTHGATHYHAHWAHPDWAEGHEPCHVTSGHKFYNDVN